MDTPILVLFVLAAALGVLVYLVLRGRAQPQFTPESKAELREIFTRLRADRLLYALMQTVEVAVVISDAWGRMLAVSASAERLFGYDEREILGLPVTVLMPVQYRERHAMAIERAWRTGEYRHLGQTLLVHGLHKTGAEFATAIRLYREEVEGVVFLMAYIQVRDGETAAA